MKDRARELDELRDRFGTRPSMARDGIRTRFVRGVEGISVDLIDGPENPYRAIYAMAISTWTPFGTSSRARWEEATPETREAVVRRALSAKALPLAMEAPKFTFEVSGPSRASFDQIARARIGVVFASLGGRDNDFSDVPFRISESTWRDPERLASKKAAIRAAHVGYAEEVARRDDSLMGPTFETAREALPMSVCWRFVMSINYAALRGFCSRRMTFSEQPDTVAVAWLIRDRLMKADGFPLLGAYLRPACDYRGVCGFHVPGDDSEAFRGLNVSCGRHPLARPCDYLKEYADHQSPGTYRDAFEAQVGCPIPGPGEGMPADFELTPRDRALFEGAFTGAYSGTEAEPTP